MAAPELDSTYVHLRDDRSAVTVPVDAGFWAQLTSGGRPELDAGRLVMEMPFERDWPTWEMHPKGEEVVVLLAGACSFLLELPGGVERLELDRVGAFAFVPRGIWHTALVPRGCRLLFITPGEGTENRPVAP